MKRLRLPFIVAGTITIAAVFFSFFIQPAGRKLTAELADGTLIVLERTALEKPTTSPHGPFSFRLYREMIAHLLTRPTFRRSSHSDSLIFWISHRNPDSGAYLDLDWFSYAKILDEHGCAFESQNHSVEASGWNAGGQPLPKAPVGSKFIIASGEFRTFPRRSRELKLQLYDLSNRLVAELAFANPVRDTFPVWTPKATPITRAIGNTSFTLLSVTNRLMVLRDNGFQSEKPVLFPDYRIRVDGVTENHWVPGETVLTDATGNETASSGYSLCTNEAAWKVTTSFYRTPDSTFAQDELWTLKDVSFPSPGSTTLFERSNQIQGLHIELRALAGAGRVIYSNGIPVQATVSTQNTTGILISASSSSSGGKSVSDIDVTSGTAQAIVEVSGLNSHHKLDLWASAPDGLHLFSPSAYSGDLILFIARGAPLPARVDLHIAVQKKPRLDFPITPPATPVSQNGLSAPELEKILKSVPKRDISIDPRHIDLTPYFTATFASDEWLTAQGPIPNGSASRSYRRFGLPIGLQVLAGVPFDVRGAIQLGGLALKQAGHSFPREVTGISIERNCERIHFLHGAIWSMNEGTTLGSYDIQYRDGGSESVPIVYGSHVRDWALQRNESPKVSNATIAWTQESPQPTSSDGVLYRVEWVNPRPLEIVQSIHFRSTMTSAAPFLVGITVD